MGRPSLLEIDEHGNFDPKVEAFFQCLKLGMTEDASCDHAGISREIVRRWKNQAKADEAEGKTDTEFLAFVAKYKNMRAECQKFLISQILKASNKSWQAAAWALERIFKGDFSAMSNAMVDDSNIQINLVKKNKDGSNGQ